MSMLHQQATRDSTQTTIGEYDNDIPNTEPTVTAYTDWKAKAYSTSGRVNPGGSGNRAVNEVHTRRYEHGPMWRYHKILKREAKLGATAMAA
jgi:hypothetical protein